MDNSLMPDWMKRAKETREAQEARIANMTKDATIAKMKIESDGPVFWKDLIEKLTIQAGFLQDAFGLAGTVNTSDSQNGEVLCRVDVNLYAVVPKSAYVNLFYRSGGMVIRCHPQFGAGQDIRFGFVEGKVILILGGEYRGPEQAAGYIIKGLVGTINPDALRTD